MKKIISSVVVCLFLFNSPFIYAQCAMYPVSLQERTQQSSIVVEGQVTSMNSFWNDDHSMIYTETEIKVYKVFKGEFNAGKIAVVTEGGQVRDEMVNVEPGIHLEVEEAGMFFLHRSNYNISQATGKTLNYELYATKQGFVQYDIVDKTAHDPFATYNDISAELYDAVLIYSGNSSYAEIQPADFFKTQHEYLIAPVISSFSPTSSYAGTKGANVLTISGMNFGSSYLAGTSKIEFRNADDGGSSYITTPDNHIQTWSSTSITTWIPTRACNGTIRVTNSSGETGTSSSSIIINYNETNVISSSGTYYQPDLVNDNGSGGYTFVYNTTFNSNTSAVAAFERALTTWRCGTLVNIGHSGTTAIAVNASDGSNVVTFDGSSALPSGVLGTSYSYYTSCATGVWYLSETDLKLRTNGTGGITWNYGPGATTSGLSDFESVVLHELGHTHQLGHTNLTPVSVMHWVISTGTDRRTLTATSEVAGGNDIMSRSVVSNSCGPSHLVALTTTAPTVAEATISAGGATTFCSGGSVVLTVAASGFSYQWKKGATNISGATTQSYTAKKTASYKCDVSNSCGTTTSNTISVAANPKPTVSISAAPCSGGAVLLTCTADPSTGVTYKWKKDGANISGATKSTYSATSSGNYQCKVTITATGCLKTSSGLDVVISCKMSEASGGDAVVVYPNPSFSAFVFSTSGFDSDGEVIICDITGKVIERQSFSGNDVMAGENLSDGIYMAKIMVNREVRRVVKLVKN